MKSSNGLTRLATNLADGASRDQVAERSEKFPESVIVTALDEVTVVIPAYNEREGIRACLENLRRVCPDINILVVDDGSTDGTAESILDMHT